MNKNILILLILYYIGFLPVFLLDNLCFINSTIGIVITITINKQSDSPNRTPKVTVNES